MHRGDGALSYGAYYQLNYQTLSILAYLAYKPLTTLASDRFYQNVSSEYTSYKRLKFSRYTVKSVNVLNVRYYSFYD